MKTEKSDSVEKGGDTMNQLKFLNEWGDFVLQEAQKAPDVYFPLVNEAHMISSVTPWLAGDCKTDQNTFLLCPASERTLAERTTGRNFWLKVQGARPWSAVGCSAAQLAKTGTPEEESCTLQGGLLWQKLLRTQPETGLQVEVLSFVPADEAQAEVMQVRIQNPTAQAVQLECVAAIPLYGRSADNLRDHRHVTSLLHRAKADAFGLELAPTLTFDERGHQPGRDVYRVWGADSENRPPRFLVPMTCDFEGAGGPLWPDGVTGQPAPEVCIREGQRAQGGEMTAALYFEPVELQPGASICYQVVLAINSDPSPYLTAQGTADALERTKAFWREKASLEVSGGKDADWSAWMRWVAIQPVLRRICGCSFLPHHDYGRGGRGWRDLWQDSLALILTEPQTIRESLLRHFAGVRPDGTNATIIGDKPGEFKADRNNIPRVWMDHGFWPFVTCRLYLNETGDEDFLFEQQPYFDDGFAFRGEGERRAVSAPRQGTVLEHLLVQNVTAFFDAGEHGSIRLRGADWNDGLDMAVQKGESVAFTAAYGGNLLALAELVERLAEEHPQLLLHPSLCRLLATPAECFEEPARRQAALLDYCGAAYAEGPAQPAEARTVAAQLRAMGQWLFDHLRKNEWVNDGGDLHWFNSYYDNHGRQVEGVNGQQVRMMLTGQVFALMSGAATDEQAREIVRAVNWYLFDPARGGYFLNTDFEEVKTDLGRMFGFAYGTKENGAVFCHMAVMYAYALYSRGMVKEGHQVLECLYRQARQFSASRILPGIPEYFDGRGQGMYPYLTGAASWFMLTVQTRMFGVRGEQGDLILAPALVADQFDENGTASIRCRFAGRWLTVVYENPEQLEGEAACIGQVLVNGAPAAMKEPGRLERALIEALPDQAEIRVRLTGAVAH